MNIAYINANTVSLAVTSTTGSVAYGVSSDFVRIVNLGSTTAYIRSGDSTVTATTSHLAIAGGAIEVFRRDWKDTHFAAITSSGTTTLSISSVGGK